MSSRNEPLLRGGIKMTESCECSEEILRNPCTWTVMTESKNPTRLLMFQLYATDENLNIERLHVIQISHSILSRCVFLHEYNLAQAQCVDDVVTILFILLENRSKNSILLVMTTRKLDSSSFVYLQCQSIEINRST
jgi:hypothetical protein